MKSGELHVTARALLLSPFRCHTRSTGANDWTTVRPTKGLGNNPFVLLLSLLLLFRLLLLSLLRLLLVFQNFAGLGLMGQNSAMGFITLIGCVAIIGPAGFKVLYRIYKDYRIQRVCRVYRI